MNKNIEFISGPFGLKATIKSKWDKSYVRILLEKDIKELELNDGKGWKGDDLSFLQFLPDLVSLTVIDLRITTIDGIGFLKKLEKLELITYCEKSIDFHLFTELRDCSFEWINESNSIFEMQKIEKLFINNYKGKSDANFVNLINLEKLSLANANIETLQGIYNLKKLTSLELSNLNKIDSLTGIKNLKNLEELVIHRCKKITNVCEIFNLNKLKRLLLLDMGGIKSIIGIERLSSLRTFLFYESTNVLDGNIAPVVDLECLTEISFQNRRHYTHKREDFKQFNG